MRILFAAPDRDLTECYEKILGADFGETVTVFDGPQVLTRLSEEAYDVVILDRALPMIGHETLLKRIEGQGIPVIVLDYPFTPEEIEAKVRQVTEQAEKGSEGDVQ